MKRTVLVLGVVLAVGLSGCTSGRQTAEEIRTSGDYWSRMDDADAMYLRGPKAQHMLDQDIASCVAQVKELVRLGAIRKSEPPRDLAIESGLARGWDSPTTDGPLYTEYQNFTDFETCMNSKGWARRQNVTPVEAQQGVINFEDVLHGRHTTVTRIGVFDDTNDKSTSYNYNSKGGAK